MAINVSLYSADKEILFSTNLDGKHHRVVIGRANLARLASLDSSKKVSRKQIMLELDQTKGLAESVSIKCTILGVNPSMLVRGRDGSIEVLDSRKSPCKIYQGDKLHLVGNLFPIIISGASASPLESSQQDAEVPAPDQLPSDNLNQVAAPAKKRKREETTDLIFYQLQEPPMKKQKSSEQEAPKSAFTVLMQSAKQVPPKPPLVETIPGAGWAGALAPYVLSPEKFPDAVYHYDDKVVVIYDKFPKAKFHFLVMPRAIVDGFRALNHSSIPMLKEMKSVADKMIKKLTSQNPGTTFRAGFHAVPSMRQLHLHVISQDFISDHLKNKKHWNSFTTKFFIDVDSFISKLTSQGSIHFDKAVFEEVLKGPIVCVLCGVTVANIPKLKSHLVTCKK